MHFTENQEHLTPAKRDFLRNQLSLNEGCEVTRTPFGVPGGW